VLQDKDFRARYQTFGNDKNLEPMMALVHSLLTVTSHKPIRAVADFAGQKIRVPGGGALQVKPMEKLGVSPISMVLPEVLPAMQTKSIDGFISGSTINVLFKYYDVTKAMTMIPSSVIIVPGVVNRGFMSKIGPELAQIVREEARNAEGPAHKWGVADVERGLKAWRDNGGEVITFPPAEAKKFIDTVTEVSLPILGANPQVKADYEVFAAVAARCRKK
jgi:TRAP-type C4-dicarboxylate transport system substrate-binding protein